MPDLTPRQEAFCHAYAAQPNGAEAARTAGYRETSARSCAAVLLAKPEIVTRVAELRSGMLEQRGEQAAALAAKLDPCYAAALKARDVPTVIHIVDAQARIRSFVKGAPTVQMKLTPAPGAIDPQRDQKIQHELRRLDQRVSDIMATIDYLRWMCQQMNIDDSAYWEDLDEEIERNRSSASDSAA